jgi:CubicO group peptidase (beta-lactamase class C family)
MKKVLVFLLLTLLLTVCVSAQDRGRETVGFSSDLDNYIRATFDKLPDIPGLAIVVIKDDEPVFIKAYGMADREAGRKADLDTMWYIASSTKAFTALAAAMLDAEGKIKFSDPFTKYTPGVKFKNEIPDKITVRDLLTHTSGLRNGILVNRLAYTGQVKQDEIDRVFAEATAFNDAAFGKYAYTNLGYNIYGLMLHYTLGKQWQDVLQQRVFDPVGLKHTTAYISRANKKKWSVAAPYIVDAPAGKMIRSVLDKTDDNMQSAGGMYMSISDLGKWISLNMNDGKFGGKQVIPAQLIRNAHTGYTKSTRNEPPFSGDGEYGLGWQIGKYRDEKVVYHHGGYAGYRTHISFLPDKKIGVGVLINNDQLGGRVADLLATYAYDRWLNVPNVETAFASELQKTVQMYEKRKNDMHVAALERAKRKWQLSKPFDAYAGRYTNELFGTIDITPRGEALFVRMGNLNALATPFTEKETIRVEMIPGGNGETMKFNVDSAGNVVSLGYAETTFTRVK